MPMDVNRMAIAERVAEILTEPPYKSRERYLRFLIAWGREDLAR
jgi:hypothetical protein